jgi:hypothetical protein
MLSHPAPRLATCTWCRTAWFLNDGSLTTVLCQHLLAGIASVVWHTRCIAAMLLRGACLPAACAVPRPRKARQPETLH